MGYEVDFLSVGSETKSGDAITLRYGDLDGGRSAQTVVIIDAGFSGDGQRVVDHVNTYYGTDRADIVVSTHPDQDHIGGLNTVLRELKVGELWMHLPWQHSNRFSLAKSFGFESVTLSEVLKNSLDSASTLESIARGRGIPSKSRSLASFRRTLHFASLVHRLPITRHSWPKYNHSS
jgi:beta-lactamase superfamily II metal-dependent hydrolase